MVKCKQQLNAASVLLDEAARMSTNDEQRHFSHRLVGAFGKCGSMDFAQRAFAAIPDFKKDAHSVPVMTLMTRGHI